MGLTPEEVALVDERRERGAREDWRPRPLSEWSDAEKLAAFDAIHAAAVEHFENVLKDEWKYRSGDRDYILFREVIERALGKEAIAAMARLRR